MDTRLSFDMFVPTRVFFGAGELNRLSSRAMPGKKALLVISCGRSVRTNGYLARTGKQLQNAGVEYVMFDRVEANPLKDTVMAGSRVARENGCDFIVALGGGSVIDAAKAISVMAVNDGDLWDYICCGTGRGKPIPSCPLPLVAITTTAGTGSETDAGCVITHPETKEKVGLKTPLLFPRLAIVDPESMVSVPPHFTAFQGFDALSHSLEGYISKFANLMSDMYAITAIGEVGRYLARAVGDGNDLEARSHVAFGNTLSGTVMCVGTTSSQHSLEHAMSAYHPELPHGAGLILLSKAYFSYVIGAHVCDERFIRMAQAMGMEDASSPEDFITALCRLHAACGVDGLKMSDYGITPDEFGTFADNALGAMGGLFACDRVELSREDCIDIYKASYR